MSAFVPRLTVIAALAGVAGGAYANGIPGYEHETNDVFEDAQVVDLAVAPYLNGKLMRRAYFGARPDTYLGAVNKTEAVIARDDNSSDLGNGKASALFGLVPIPDGDGGAPTIRLWVTGRPDGLDSDFNGLFFNGPHQQFGEFTLHVEYFGDPVGVPPRSEIEPIGSETVVAEFVTGAESFRFNFFPPEGTLFVDARIDNSTGTQPVADDVDHYSLTGLDPLCDYAITVIGGVTEDDCRPSDTVLGWFNKNGELIATDANSGPAPSYPQLTALTDSNGRLRIAVTGRGDFDFNGLVDAFEDGRNIDAPIPLPPLVHGVVGCYTIIAERVEHEVSPEPGEIEYNRTLLERGDLNQDGGVDVVDLARLLNNFGWTAP